MFYDGSIHIEEDDQCYTCEYFNKGIACPLLEALATGVVNLEEEVTVQNCGFYKKFKRSLRLMDLPGNVPLEISEEVTQDTPEPSECAEVTKLRPRLKASEQLPPDDRLENL